MSQAAVARTVTDLSSITAHILSRPLARRTIVAVVGPPGAGKSTVAEHLKAALNEHAAVAELVPMDGFHLDNVFLDARAMRGRKGAPDTFDVAGLAATLARLRDDADAEVLVPLFDRERDLSRAGARSVDPAHRVVIVEGNYLLLDRPGWRDLRATFDVTVMLDVEVPELRRRLEDRWTELGLSHDEIRRKVEGNDLVNAAVVQRESAATDFVLRNQGV